MALVDPSSPSSPYRITGSFVLAARQFPRHRAAMAGLVLLVLICLASALAPWIAPFDPVQIKLSAKLKPPSFEHLLGTDHFGRDVFSRLIYGGRTSLSVGVLVVLFAFVLGVPLGLASGYFGGRIDNLLMRLVDAFLTFPPLLLAVALVGLLGPDIQNVMLALGLVQAPVLARIVRGSTLAVREDVYVTAARALGARPTRIVLSHILRNVVSPIVVQLTIVFSAAVVAEASLSFLGFGTQPPQPSWGRDMSEARRFLGDAPWMFMAPTGTIMLCVLSINFMGDGLRDALDPRAWRTRRQLAKGEG
ncbi:MAG: ABC transporter permease [Reyranella sp.]|nr:ABC transporter permease [Reyranella sp.]